MVRLQPSDGDEIPVGKLPAHLEILFALVADPTTERAVAERSILIKNLLDDLPDSANTEAIPIMNVSRPPPLSALSPCANPDTRSTKSF
jgi:hypothetical protein